METREKRVEEVDVELTLEEANREKMAAAYSSPRVHKILTTDLPFKEKQSRSLAVVMRAYRRFMRPGVISQLRQEEAEHRANMRVILQGGRRW